MGMEQQNWTMEQWKKMAWSDESRFLLQHVAGQVRVRDGSRMHCGKKASWWRQCDALGYILLGNLGSWHSRGCYLDTYHLPKHCCRPRTPFHDNSIPRWYWSLSVGQCTLPHCKKRSGMVMEYDKEFKVLTWPPNSPNLNPVEYLWDVLQKKHLVPWRPHLTTYRT